MSDRQSLATATPHRSWRKWIRRFLLSVLALLIVAVVALFGTRAYLRNTGNRDLEAEKARLDAEDPGWRFDDLMAARKKAAPAENENSAVIVREVRTLIPKEWNDWLNRPNQSQDQPPPLNQTLLLEDLTRDEALAESTRKARERGRILRNYPHGYHEVAVSDSPFVESMSETQGARHVAALMRVDALLAAKSGDSVHAIRAAHAILNIGRSIGDEPTLISSLVRFACRAIAAEAVMRALGVTDSKAALSELAALQAAFSAELDEPVLLFGLRGERAFINRFYDGLNNGTIGADQLAKMGNGEAPAGGRVNLYFFQSFLPEDQRRFLQISTELVNAVRGPTQEQLTKTQQIEDNVRANRSAVYPFYRMLLPATVKVTESSLRNRAELLSAVALIACERFRLIHGRWPNSLAELPKDLLPAIPPDPFTGESIKFAKLPDGITVYAVPPKEMYPSGSKRLTNPLGEREIGWRLYDPKQRGLPPIPKPKTDTPDEQP